MVLIAIEDGSALSFYTEDEKMQTMTDPGFRVDPEVLQERMDDSLVEYLESDLHLRLVQDRLDIVILKYPNISFDVDSMKVIADTKEDVRAKFDILRSYNMDLEAIRMDEATPSGKGRNQHFHQLLCFQWEYINALSSGKRVIELALIKELPAILNKELGNYTGLQDLPTLFFEGVGKGIGGITTFAGNVVGDIFGGALSGIAPTLLGENWQKKLLIYGIIIIIIVIVALIGWYYGKSFISEKGRVRART